MATEKTTKAQKPIGKAPAPRGGKRKHTKPAVSREAKEAVEVSRQMYASLLEEGAPKAGPMGYLLGACTVLKMLVDQAEQQGSNREELKQYALRFVNEL